jgi:hypothetical protein
VICVFLDLLLVLGVFLVQLLPLLLLLGRFQVLRFFHDVHLFLGLLGLELDIQIGRFGL